MSFCKIDERGGAVHEVLHTAVQSSSKLLQILPGGFADIFLPLFVLLNSYTTGFAPGVLDYLLKKVIAPGRGGVTEADEIGLPVGRTGGSEPGLYLPCGSSGRWSFR